MDRGLPAQPPLRRHTEQRKAGWARLLSEVQSGGTAIGSTGQVSRAVTPPQPFQLLCLGASGQVLTLNLNFVSTLATCQVQLGSQEQISPWWGMGGRLGVSENEPAFLSGTIFYH